MYDVIVLGGGPAGLTAATYAGRAGLSTLVMEGLITGGQMGNTNDIENYPGFPEGISGAELGQLMEKQAKRFGAELAAEKVTSVELEGESKKVMTPAGIYGAKAIIAATGAQPRKLGLPGEAELTGRGVSYCATCDGFFYRGKDVAVVGGGDTALEDAIFLANIANKVYLIHRRDEFRGSTLLQQRVRELANVELVLSHVPGSIEGEGGVQAINVSSVKDNAERKLAVDGVFVAVGVLPNTELFKGKLELNEGGYIVTDATMHTSAAGVFAAGDCRNTPLRQVVTACGDAAIAAYEAEKYIL